MYIEISSTKREVVIPKLQKNLIYATVNSKSFQLALTIKGIKFDEQRAVLRLDLETYKGFCIGDICIPTQEELTSQDIHKYYVVMGFVEFQGHVVHGKGIKIKDILLILARGHDVTPEGYPYDTLIVVRKDNVRIKPILAFSVNGIKKI